MTKTVTKLFSGLIILSLFVLSCGDDPYRPDYSGVPDPYSTANAERVESETGLISYTIEEGSGEFEVVYRDIIQFRYTVRSSAGKIINSSYTNLNTNPVGAQVSTTSTTSLLYHSGIKEGFLGMKPGGIKVLFIPPSLHSYSSSSIADDTIRVDIELTGISL